MGPVARGDPEFAVVHVRGDDLLITSLAVLLPNEAHQRVVDVSSARQKEAATRTHLMEEEEVVFFAELAMVSLGRLLLQELPFLELLGVREGDAINPLQRI